MHFTGRSVLASRLFSAFCRSSSTEVNNRHSHFLTTSNRICWIITGLPVAWSAAAISTSALFRRCYSTPSAEKTNRNNNSSKILLDSEICHYIIEKRRNFSMESFRTMKEKMLKMPIEEKRRLYKCKDGFVELSKIPTWTPSYFSNKPGGSVIKAKPNPQLAEKVCMWTGDITSLEIDAIVNAANKKLLGGGGVDGAIHRSAGPCLKQECETLRGCETGDAKITGGYNLPAKYVIHTVGPVGINPEGLKSCYERSLTVLKENNLKTIAFPCISTGIYGYPNEDAAIVALESVRNWLEKPDNSSKVERIIFCLFLNVDIEIYSRLMPMYFPIEENPT